MYCSMPKDTSRAEATLNSEKINPVALAVIELRLSVGSSEGLFGCLSNTASSLSGKSEAGFWVKFFMDHTYSFVVPTIQYYHTV